MMEIPMAKPYDLSKPLVALDHDSTLVAVVEMSGTSWLVLAIVPGIDRRPLQKLPVDENRLFRQLEIWVSRAGRRRPWFRQEDIHRGAGAQAAAE
jgi:transposase